MTFIFILDNNKDIHTFSIDITQTNNIKCVLHNSILNHLVNIHVRVIDYLISIYKHYKPLISCSYYKFLQYTYIKTYDNKKIKSEYKSIQDLNINDISEIIFHLNKKSFDCPVCLEEKINALKTFICKHKICKECRIEIIKSETCSKSCPVCRCSQYI